MMDAVEAEAKLGQGGKSEYVQPWGETKKDFKERIQRQGHWVPFLIERAAYRFRGCPPGLAHLLAMQHFPPPGFRIQMMRVSSSTDMTGLGGHRGVTEQKMRDRLAQQLGAEGYAHAVDFDGRDCSPQQAMAWVAENLAIKMTTRDAPSRLAWSVYEWAKANPGNTKRFYEMYLPSLLSRQSASDSTDPFAGVVAEEEDVGLPQPSVVPDALPGDSNGPGGEHALEEDDDLAGFS